MDEMKSEPLNHSQYIQGLWMSGSSVIQSHFSEQQIIFRLSLPNVHPIPQVPVDPAVQTALKNQHVYLLFAK